MTINLELISYGENRTIEVSNLSNSIITTFNNSEVQNLNYDNLIINIYPSYSSINPQNFFNSISGFNNDLNFFIIIIILICLCLVGFKLLGKIRS